MAPAYLTPRAQFHGSGCPLMLRNHDVHALQCCKVYINVVDVTYLVRGCVRSRSNALLPRVMRIREVGPCEGQHFCRLTRICGIF